MGCFPSKKRNVVSSLSSHDHSYFAQKIRRLHTSGVMVLIDAANVEIEGQKLSWELRHGTKGFDHSWRMHYSNLIELISRNGDLRKPKRRVVAAHLVSSEKQLMTHRFSPGRKTWQKLGITLTIPSSRNIPSGRGPKDRRRFSPTEKGQGIEEDAATKGEKAVDHTLVRIMTQEFEGLHLLHREQEKRPSRTFALVAGDFDYVDVVDQARLSGCDVEIWYWTERHSLSNQWVREESRRHDSLGKLSFHDLREHFTILSAVDEVGDLLPGDKQERLSVSSGRSQEVAPPVHISGATGRRRFFGRGSMTGEGTPETPRNLTVSDMGATFSIPSPESSASTSRQHSSVLVSSPDTEIKKNRCQFREFCPQENCTMKHTEAELRHFKLHGGKGRYRLTKTVKCKGGKSCQKSEKPPRICSFLHDNEYPLCVNCLMVHEVRECAVDRQRPLNPLEARPLVQEGYLVDLLVTKEVKK